ncbi:hypothetical protein Bca4012_090069 [Brassica carinata]
MTNPYLHHKCFVTLGKYKPGSQYEKNLKRIINEFPKGSFKRGFISMTLGESPDFIVMLFQCRGDTHGPKCRSCYATAKPEFFKRCPRHKGGIIWYDQCSLYFSTIDSLGMIDYDNNFCMSNATKISDDLYNQVKPRHFIDDMIQNATREAKRDAPYYMAEEKRVGKETIYGMAECSFDMSQKNYNFLVTDIIEMMGDATVRMKPMQKTQPFSTQEDLWSRHKGNRYSGVEAGNATVEDVAVSRRGDFGIFGKKWIQQNIAF